MKINSQFKLLIFVIALIVFYFSKLIIITTGIGVGIGVIMSPLLDKIKIKLRLRRGIGAIILIVSFLLITCGITFLFGQVVVDQAQLFIEHLPKFSSQLQAQLQSIFIRFPWILSKIKEIDFASIFQQLVQYIFQGAQMGIALIGGFTFALVIGIHLAVNSEFYFNGLVRIFQPHYRAKARKLLIKCAQVIRIWFRAQLLDMAIMGVITTIALFILGVNYWALFGLMTALFGIIPYVGILFVVSLVTLFTLASDISQVPWVLLIFVITQAIEGNIILPLVMKGQAEIPEVILMVVMLFFGLWFGIIGIFIAPASVAVGICLYRNLYLPYIESEEDVFM